MGTSIKCWFVSKDVKPVEVKAGAPDFEKHLEDWIEKQVEIVDPSLLIIGRQIENIDLLAINDEGQLVIIELKRDQLPRTVIAQALSYASMVATWAPEKIIAVANEYLSKSGKTVHDAFNERFGKDLEDTGVNSDQVMMLVGCRTDPMLEQMITWLSEHHVPMNVVTLSFFMLPDGQSVLVRSLLVPEEEIKTISNEKTGRRPPMSLDRIRDLTDELSLAELLAPFEGLNQLRSLTRGCSVYGIDYEVEIPRADERPLRRKVFQILLRSSKQGQLRVGIIAANLAQFLGVDKDEVMRALPDMKWDPHVRWRLETDLRSPGECRKLFEAVAHLLQRNQEEKD